MQDPICLFACLCQLLCFCMIDETENLVLKISNAGFIVLGTFRSMTLRKFSVRQ